jgi:hypothetical protein
MNRRLVCWPIGAFALLAACTEAYLYDQRRDTQVPVDRSVAVVGKFCTPSTNEVIQPINILIAMDASQSMRVTDPDGTRAQAVVNLLEGLPQEKEIAFAVMLFAGSTTAFLTKSNMATFESITDYSTEDRTKLRQQILNFATPGNSANRDSTDFVKPLSDIYALINRDLVRSRNLDGGTTRPRYSVLFLSDGQPTVNQDDELLCGDAVRRIRQLKDLADDVRVNTINVFLPTQPVASSACEFDGGITIPAGGPSCRIPNLPPGTCPLLIVNQNAERLQKMAELGGGDFRDFRNNEPINFLNFRFGQVRRTFVFDKLVVSNFSAPPSSDIDKADTDSDGLLDADETREGTSIWEADSDRDGFSDGVEVYFRERGANFTPNQRPTADGGGIDPGCPPELRGVDGDCDGLLDCDEQLIGTNARKMDSDDDGLADSIEWKGLSQPASNDLGQDPDNDGIQNGEEVPRHTNPLAIDSASVSTIGYRYEVKRDPAVTETGAQCFSFRVDNVLLANTLRDTRDAGVLYPGGSAVRRGAGYNDIFITASMVPAGEMRPRTLVRALRSQSTRFPVGGIRSPPDGIINVEASDFGQTCSTK